MILSLIVDIPRYLFGDNSQLVPPQNTMFEMESRVALWFVAVVVATIVYYLLWLNHWFVRGDNHTSLFRYMGFHRGDYSSKTKFITPSFNWYLPSGVLLSFMLFFIFCAKMFEFDTNELYNTSWRDNLTLFIVLPAIYLYQIIFLFIVGNVALKQPIIKLIVQLKALCYSFLTITAAPAILFYALSNHNTEQTLFYVACIQIIMSTILFLFEILILFINKKVSLLHTILYLCAVELFPMTLIWGLFGR